MFTTPKVQKAHIPYSTLLIILIAGIVVFFAGCKANPTGPGTPPVSTVFTLGTKVTAATQNISSGGGTVIVSGVPLNGLTITVPDTAYSGSRTFTVSTAPITATRLNSSIIALTPMISVSNGGGYSTGIMTMQIPITLPTGSIAGAFYYNESTGELEPIPVDAESSTSITISTRHFSTSTLTSGAHYGKTQILSDLSYSDIVILAMDETKLFSVGNQVTNFTPGVDDWEFTNYGSYIAPGGHCAGQSLSSMWYFSQKKTGLNHQLNGYLSTNPNLNVNPSADRLGYRFASAVQTDQKFTNWVQHISFQSWNPSFTFRLFLLNTYVSKQPQYLIMYRSADTVGHAMVCYGVRYTDAQNGTLLIADPNHPGDPQTINFTGGQFQDYGTGLTADGAVVAFNRFGVLAKTAYVAWDQISTRWDQVQNKTIGTIPPHAFPAYTLSYFNSDAGAYVNMPSNFTISSDTLAMNWSVPGAVDSRLQAFHPDGSSFTWVKNKLVLQYGQNIIGIYVKAVNPNDRSQTLRWVDFIWDTVYSNQLAIDPATMTGEPNHSYSWSASAGYIPNNARYEWDFGDQTAKQVLYNEGSASHTYSQQGVYTVTLSLFDNAKNQLLGTARATATIEGDIWKLIHQIQYAQVELAGTITYDDGSKELSFGTIPDLVLYDPVTWDNSNTFSAVLNYRTESGTVGDYDSETCIFHGTFAADGYTIASMTVYHRELWVSYYSPGKPEKIYEDVMSYTISNAVGVTDPNNQFLPRYYYTTGLENLVSNISRQKTTTRYDMYDGTPTTATQTLTSVEWTGYPMLDITFQ